MATFITLTNGDTLSPAAIRELSKGSKINPGTGYGSLNETDEERAKRKRYTITIMRKGGRELTLSYTDEAERDAEYERIQSILHAKPQVYFPNLSLNLASVQYVQVEPDFSSFYLKVKVAGSKTIFISVSHHNENEVENARKFLAHFDLEVPAPESFAI
jgi:hypothetical protein